MRLESAAHLQQVESRSQAGLLTKPARGLQDSPLHKLYKQRCTPKRKHSKLRNKAFLTTLVLEGEGHCTAIPSAWRVPHDELPTAGSKRKSPKTPEKAEVEGGCALTELLVRWRLVFKLSMCLQVVQEGMWLHSHPSMHISFCCKHADPAITVDKRAEHQKLHFALQNSTHGPNSAAKQTCDIYHVGVRLYQTSSYIMALCTYVSGACNAGAEKQFSSPWPPWTCSRSLWSMQQTMGRHST